MSDHRTRREKLQAMADQAASPAEAAVARAMLRNLDRDQARTKSPGILSRAAILAKPDRASSPRTMSYTTRAGVRVTFDLDEEEED